MKNHYIQAIIELIRLETDTTLVFEGLKKTMQSKGHMRLYTPVLRGVLRILETKKDSSGSIVVVAKDTDIQKYTNLIKETLSAIEAPEDFSTKIDETIIGGVVIKSKNTILDRSHKTALTNLYRSITL